jgi:hypothetical protein
MDQLSFESSSFQEQQAAEAKTTCHNTMRLVEMSNLVLVVPCLPCRGLIMEQFRSSGEVLLGVMDGHGSHGHLVSTFLLQHLPAVLMQQLVGAAAALLPGAPGGSSSDRPAHTRHTDSNRQQQQQQQVSDRTGSDWTTHTTFVVVPQHSHQELHSVQQQQQRRHGKPVVRHKLLPVHPDNSCSSVPNAMVGPGKPSSSSSSSNSFDSSSSSSSPDTVVPSSLVNCVPLTPVLLNSVFLETDQQLTGSGINVLDSGSTALLCHIDHDKITTAWVGDSRAILGRRVSGSSSSTTTNNNRTGHWQQQEQQQQQQGQWQVVQLSDDHKPERPDEQASGHHSTSQQLAFHSVCLFGDGVTAALLRCI